MENEAPVDEMETRLGWRCRGLGMLHGTITFLRAFVSLDAFGRACNHVTVDQACSRELDNTRGLNLLALWLSRDACCSIKVFCAITVYSLAAIRK